MRTALAILALAFAVANRASAEEPIRFARDIQPILADKCFACHGPDETTREADLRLDSREAACEDRGEFTAIAPGHPERSELIRRVGLENGERMPPPKSGKRLTSSEIDLLRRWIAQGAEWETHWSFVPPRRPQVPVAKSEDGQPSSWPRNAIDHFVWDRLRRDGRGLAVAPEANRRTLIRRLSLDLIGLPPTPEEVEAFVADRSAGAYESLVDRLLASPRFGERMAMVWLDAARYSDTDGFQGDDTRSNWPWRDWVIDSYNRNLPFDQFTIEQFAGDLLPNATPEQKLATCFHRNHMTNGEGGRDPEESRVDYVMDRVSTTGTVWLGLTLGCVQCHSHKFDPISHADYYRLFAFFDSIDEDGKASSSAKPYLAYSSPWGKTAIASARGELANQRLALKKIEDQASAGSADWIAERFRERSKTFRAWRPMPIAKLSSTDGTILSKEPDGAVQAGGPDPHHEDYRIIGSAPAPRITGLRLDVLPHESHNGGGLSRSETGHIILTGLKINVRIRDSRQIKEIPIVAAIADYSPKKTADKAYGPIVDVLDDDPRTGWTTIGADPKQPRQAVFAFAEPVALGPDDEVIVELSQRSLAGRSNIGRFRLWLTDQPGPAPRSLGPAPLEDLAGVEALEAIPEPLRKRLREQFLADQPAIPRAQQAVARAEKRLAEVRAASAPVQVMVLADRKEPRASHVRQRGVWDQKGEKVAPGVPNAIAPWPADAPKNRLGLARWLVDRKNPLTARAAVNRHWRMLFGEGLARTLEDLGAQGERPSHPELLDWLAVEFIESGWDVKRSLKTMAMSATYRQSSIATPEALTVDPDNRLLARGARFRMPSWMIRDSALQASGLLNPALGGPPVRPYQPDGVWEENTMDRFHYEPSQGADQYRRTVYAFWRRSVAPTFLFDSAQRRVCEVRVPKTNTPLHALTLLNDVTYVEAARKLAERAIAETPNAEPQDRLNVMARRVLARPPSDREAAILLKSHQTALDHYRARRAEAERLLSHGQSPVDPARDAAELASYAVVAAVILNLDEAITRE